MLCNMRISRGAAYCSDPGVLQNLGAQIGAVRLQLNLDVL